MNDTLYAPFAMVPMEESVVVSDVVSIGHVRWLNELMRVGLSVQVGLSSKV